MKKLKLISLIVMGLIIVSCGKPTDPESLTNPDGGGYKIVGKFATTGYAQDVIVKDTLVYIAQGEGGLTIIDVSDRKNPAFVSVTHEQVRGYSSKIEMKDNAIYLAAGSFGVTVLTVEDPFNPLVTVSNITMKPAKNLHIMGDYLFTSISEHGFALANINNSLHPEVLAETKTSGFTRGTIHTPDSTKLLAACGEMGLSVLDISDFANGYGIYPIIGWGDTPGYAQEIALLDDEDIAFIASGTEGLQVVDFSDLDNIHVVGSFNGGGYAKEILYKDGFVYLTARGLQIINVSDYTNPYLHGSIYTEYALGVDMDDNYIYIADEIEGLVIVSIPE